MKIVNNMRETEVRFETLKSGDVFEWANDFYIKTRTDHLAVRLDDGETDEFARDFLVCPIEATLTVS